MKKLFLLLSVVLLCSLSCMGLANQEKIMRSPDGDFMAGEVSCDTLGETFLFHLDDDWYTCTSSSDVTLRAKDAVQDWQLLCTGGDDTYAVGLFDALEFDLLSATGQVSCLRRFSMEELFAVMDMGYGDVSYELTDLAATDEALWLLMTCYDGAPSMVLRFDLAEQTLRRMPWPSVQAIDRYDQERLIALTEDNRLVCLDEQGTSTALASLQPEHVTAFAYNRQCGMGYFIQDEQVKRWRPETGVEVAEETCRMPGGYMSKGCVSDDGRYMMASSTAIYLCDPAGEDGEAMTLLGELPRSMQFAYEDQYDTMLRKQAGTAFVTLEDYADRMVTRDDSFDAAVIHSSLCVLPFLQEKGYFGAIGSDALIAKALYPQVAAYLCPEGPWTAVPVSASLTCLCVNQPLLEELGLTVDDLPQTLPEWIAWLADWEDCFPDAPANIQPMAERYDLRRSLMAMLVNDYLDQTPEPVTFAEPYLAQTIRAIEDGEHTWEKLESFDESLYEKVHYLFSELDPLSPQVATEGWLPWPLRLTAEHEPMLTLQMALLVINPYSGQIDKAGQLTDFCAAHWDDKTTLLLSSAWEGPVETPRYRKLMAEAQEEAALLTAQGETDMAREVLRSSELLRWEVTPEQAAWYRANVEHICVTGSGSFLCNTKEQLGRLFVAFSRGGMSGERVLAELQRMALMAAMESE